MQITRPLRRVHRLPLVSLVDVVFILLFFFMLASSPARDPRSVPVTLEAGGASGASGPAQAYLQAQPPLQLRLRAGPQARLQDLLGVMDQLHAAGWAHVLEAPP
jgi:biopolymer transport protein ExbD